MFKQWCASQNFNNATNLSHALMDGGVLSVPSDRLTDFYKKCVECIRVGEPIFVVEQKTPIYNFFVDIDYKDTEPLPLETIKMMTSIICEKVETFGAPECLVSIAKPKPVGEGKIKSGVHMNWPGFPVDQTRALFLRHHIICVLTKMYCTIDWEAVVDKAVYGSLTGSNKGAGFRMPWSHKKSRHGECKGKGCELCTGGRIVESPYLPVFLFKNKSIEPLDYTEPCVETLIAATVRSEATVSSEVEATFEVPSPVHIQAKDEIVNSELSVRLQMFIRGNLKGQERCETSKIIKHAKSFSCGSNSRFCENAGREHVSNHVWFSIYDGRITQKCFDEECKDFSSREFLLGPSILKLLYPDRNVLSFVGTGISSTVLGAKRGKGLAKRLQA